MKKVMVAILFLIPLIIVMTVNISGAIISATIKISVESIILKNRGEYISEIYINFNEYNDPNKYYNISAVCYPKLAQVNLLWSSSDLTIAYVDEGKVYFVGYGEVVITAYSADNYNVNARCTFIVTGDTVYSLDIVEYGSETSIASLDIALYDRILLDKVIVPANALKDKFLYWTSSDEDVAMVDNNGVVEAFSIGTTEITIAVDEEDGWVKDTVTVNVMPSYNLLKRNLVYSAADTVDLADFARSSGFSVEIISGNASKDGTEITYNGAVSGSVTAEVELSGSSVREEITIYFTKGAYMLGFANLDVLQEAVWSEHNYVWAGSANVVLTPIVLNYDYTGDVPKVSWTTSDDAVIEVEEGRLYGLTGGISTIGIHAAGFTSGIIDISVKSPMESVSLLLDNSGDVRGIEGVRVFGIQSYHYDDADNAYIDNTYQLTVSSYYPANAEQVYDYRSSDTEYATVDEEGLITFNQAGIGHKVIIYITARYSISAKPVRDYYEFTLVDGVNIGLDIAANENIDDAPIYRVFTEFRQIANNSEAKYSIVLHSNIYVPPSSQGGGSSDIYGNLYGNGYKLDGQFLEKDYATTLIYMHWNFGGPEQVIRNLTVNGCAPVDDFSVYTESGGTTFCIGDYDEKIEGRPIVFRYVLIQYAFTNIYLYGGDLVLDGCVLRNTAGPTINSNTDTGWAPNVTVNNCIFSNTIAPIMILYTYFDLNNMNKEMGKYGSLTLTGKNYIYNWKEIQNLKLDIIPSNALPNGLATTFNNKINDTVRAEIKNEKYDIIKVEGEDPVTHFNKTYINFSFFVIGVWRDASPFELNYDPDEFLNVELDISETEIGLLFPNFTNPCYLLTPKNSNGVPSTLPGETYELDNKTLARLRGES